jgi:transketolase
MARGESITQLGFGTDDVFMHEVGSQAYARKKFGLTAENMSSRIAQALNN